MRAVTPRLTTGPIQTFVTAMCFIVGAVFLGHEASADNRSGTAAGGTIRIDCTNRVGRISRLLYGAGFEHLGGAVNRGLEAQMLDGVSFEEDDVDEDGVSDKWQPFGWGENVPTYNRDGRYSYHGPYCQQVTVLAHKSGERGIRQGGLAVEADKSYTATLHLKRWGRSPVRIALADGEHVLARATLRDVASKWRRYTVRLSSKATSTAAEFRITLAGPGTLWIDQVALVPDDTYQGHGTRKDLMKRIVTLSPTIIRWPGGWFAEVYRWKFGVGDVFRRPLLRKFYSDARRRRNPSWEPNRFGSDEFIRFCRDIGAEPLITVNSAFAPGANEDEMIQEAVDWIEYCNGDKTTKFGALRAANGHPEPYRVRYWGVGNEVWEMGPEAYARRFVRFAKAMKAKDPNIKLLAVGGITPDRKWNRTLLRVGGEFIDYIDLHHYESDPDYLQFVAMPIEYGKLLDELRQTIAEQAPGRDIKVAVMEWNSNSNWQDGSKLKEGLFAAAWMNMLERHSDIVAMAGAWPLLRRVQPPGNHVADHGLIWFDNARSYYSPTGLAVQLYRRNYAPERLTCTVECDTYDAGDRKNVPYLDAVATRDPDKGLLILKVVNRHPTDAITAEIEMSGLSASPRDATIQVSTLTASDLMASNRIDHPNDVRIVDSADRVSLPKFHYRFPAHSATVLRLELAGR
ncbi:MAG: hypothetical protein GXP27_16830 [Planctomycetes bacterium]|nr:hypothetical protein [Planctomycetota bacterium]